MADEKAHKEVWCCKGASGLKRCLECKNIAREVLIVELDRIGMLGISCTDDARSDRHTDESVFEMRDHLQATLDGGATNAEMKQL